MDTEDLKNNPPYIGPQSECIQINAVNKNDLDSIYLSDTLIDNWIKPIYLKRSWKAAFKAFMKKMIGFDPLEENYFLTYHQEETTENLPADEQSIKPVYDQVGDEILKVIIFPRLQKNRPRVVFIARMQLSPTNMEYLEKAYLPLEKLLGTSSPDLVVVDVGACQEITRSPREESPEIIDEYALIPGEINFRVFKRLIYPYESSIKSASEFLEENRKLRDLSIANGLLSDFLESQNLLILKRMDLSVPELFKDTMQALRKDRSLRLTTSANMVNSLAIGLHEGALIFPVIAFLDGKLQVWIYLSIFIQYLFYNLTPLLDIKMSTKSDEWFEALQGRRFNQHLINREMRDYQSGAALCSIISVIALTFLFPPFFEPLLSPLLSHFNLQIAAVVCYLFYLVFNMLNFQMDSIVSQTLLRQNEITNRILISISAFERAARILVNATGFGLGWVMMSLYPQFGIIPAIAFGVIGCFSKYLFPVYGGAAKMTLVCSHHLLKLDNYNFSIVPDSLRLQFDNKVLFSYKSGRYITYVDDPEDIRIILDTPEKASFLKIRRKRHLWFSHKTYTWVLIYQEGRKGDQIRPWNRKIKFQLHTREKYDLVSVPTEHDMVFAFQKTGTRPEV